MNLTIGKALSKDDFAIVERKVKALIAGGHCTAATLAHWVDEKAEGARQIPCANSFLTWAEYECYHKYSPEFNKLS